MSISIEVIENPQVKALFVLVYGVQLETIQDVFLMGGRLYFDEAFIELPADVLGQLKGRTVTIGMPDLSFGVEVLL